MRMQRASPVEAVTKRAAGMSLSMFDVGAWHTFARAMGADRAVAFDTSLLDRVS
jgi:hypothetical protein